jgi:phage shock protein C
MERQRLRRSREDRVIAGVCAGIADYFGWSPTRVRVAYVVISVLSAAFPGLLVYAVLWVLMPESGRRPEP